MYNETTVEWVYCTSRNRRTNYRNCNECIYESYKLQSEQNEPVRRILDRKYDGK